MRCRSNPTSPQGEPARGASGRPPSPARMQITSLFGTPQHESESFVKRRQSATFAAELNRNSRVLSSSATINNLLGASFKLTDAEAFKEEVRKNRVRIRKMSRSIIHPHSRFLRIWDVVTMLALVFTAFITPFEVGFFDSSIDPYQGPVNFTLNRLIDTIFLLDIAITFFVPYKTSIKHGGIVVFDHRRIASHYLHGWFFFDLLTATPFDLIVGCIAVAQGWGADASAQLIQLLRVVRLAKLLRIVRASRIIRRWQDHVSISFALLSLAKFIFLTLLLAHWLACGWGFVAIASDEPWEACESDQAPRHQAAQLPLCVLALFPTRRSGEQQ
jgi:hypothetical protein